MPNVRLRGTSLCRLANLRRAIHSEVGPFCPASHAPKGSSQDQSPVGGMMSNDTAAKPRKKKYRWVLAALAITGVVTILVGRPVYLWSRAWLRDRPVVDEIRSDEVDDASRMNRTPVAEVWSIPAEPTIAEEQLRELLARARRDGLRVAIAGRGIRWGDTRSIPTALCSTCSASTPWN